MTAALLRHARQSLPAWFAAHARDLPWRRNRTAYRVWVSELMLQQTRVETAVPYYRRFLKAFPSVAALARAEEQEVLKLWEGLGYYSRARRARDTARHLTTHRGGRFPRTAADLEALPGIGPYTAAAVASLAFGEPVPVVDGNVIRVVSRWFGLEAPADSPALKEQVRELAGRLLPPDRPGVFNEAMMELGATVCTPRRPACAGCPMRTVCRARRSGAPEAYPGPKPKKTNPVREVGAGVVVGRDGRILIARRRSGDMLGGLWEFPGGGVDAGESLPDCIRRELREELGIEVRVVRHLVSVRHVFSHFTMNLHAWLAAHTGGTPEARQCDDWAWVDLDGIDRYPLPRADRKVLEALVADAASSGGRVVPEAPGGP